MAVNDGAEVAVVKLSEIKFGERRRIDYGKLEELAESIRSKGLITSLTVKYTEEDGFKYLLLAGGRRYKACELVGLTEVPVRIYNRDLSELELRGIELAENIDRKDLEWTERVRLCKEIDDLQRQIHGSKSSGGIGDGTGWKQGDTANLIGVSRSKVTQDIKVAEALEMFPELATCKTQDEVMKRLNKLRNSVEREVITENLMKKAKLSPSDALRTEIINSYIIGDFFDKIKAIPDKSIDFAEIDTPYAIDLKSNKASSDGLSLITSDYNEWPHDQFLFKIDTLLKEVNRVLKDDAWIVFWFGPDPWFESLYELLIRNGFKTRRIPGIWLKGIEGSEGSGQTQQPNIYLANSFEMFFYARKGNPVLQKPGRSNVFSYKPVYSGSKIHPTERPIEMIMDICDTFCPIGGRILVPFAGSGNTILAANNTLRNAFGYDLAKEYKEDFIIRVFEGSPGKFRSYKETA